MRCTGWLLAVSLFGICGCGRLGFGDDEERLRLGVGLVTGVYTVDAKLCLEREAEVQYAVTTVAWPRDWAPEDFGALSAGDGVAKQGAVRGAASECTRVTVPVNAADEATVYLYAMIDDAEAGVVLTSEAAEQLHPAFTLQTFPVRAGYEARYWVHYPESYYRDPATPLPTLLYLHGNNSTGDNAGSNINKVRDYEELPRLYQQRSEHVTDLPFLVYAPQCNAQQVGCFSWGDVTLMTFLDNVLLDLREQAPVDDHHFYVTGLSTGGEGSWRYAIHRPELVAALVSIANTYSPDTPSQDFFKSKICSMAQVAVWGFHSAPDTSQPPENSLTVAQKLEACLPRVAPKINLGNWMFEGQTHAGWVEVYGNTHGFENAGHRSVYDWLLSHSR